MNEVIEKEYSFLSNNKYSDIYVKMWIPKGEIKAILQLSHGMNEHMGRYDEFANYLAGNGIMVVGNDHMGHGNSVITPDDYGYFAIPVIGGTKKQREKYSSSNLAVMDMYQITKTVKKHYPNIPYYLLGHSMGSMLSQRYAMQYGKEIDGLLLTGIVYVDKNLLIPGKLICKLIATIKGERHRSEFFNNLIFGKFLSRIKKPKTKYDWICTDDNEVDKFINDDKCKFRFTMNGFETLISTLQFIQDERNLKKIPKNLNVFMISGSEDPCGNYGKYLCELYDIYKYFGIEDVSKKLYKDCRHELVNERIKYEMFEDVKTWIEDKID
ncbi:MAG: alpha/beta fold hydrolase [Lachnospiraceae bacterium]|nr:alpha/beta fold hydrolase [Lachnospiraceae bacterium]